MRFPLPTNVRRDVNRAGAPMLRFEWNWSDGTLHLVGGTPRLRVGCTVRDLHNWTEDLVVTLLGIGSTCDTIDCSICEEAFERTLAAWVLLEFVKEHWRGLLDGTATLD